MTTVSFPAEPRSSLRAEAQADNRRVLFVLGLLTPLGVFTTFSVSDLPVSIMWFAAVITACSGPLRIRKLHVLFLLLCAVLCIKVALGGAAGVAAKFSIGVLFLLCMGAVRYRDGLAFFEGLNLMLPLCLVYAAYQWIVFLLADDPSALGATLPVEWWNSKGWHALLPDGMNLPRVPAFMFEPAYFAMVLGVALMGELLYRRGRARPWLIAQILIGLLMANSRIGLVAAVAVLLTTWLVRKNRRGLLKWTAVFAAVGPLLPLFFIFDQLIDFANNGEGIDISIFARYISFAAFAQQEPSSVLFGVLNYRDTFANTPLLSNFSDLLELQGSDQDPKSFLASNLFQFGVIGSLAFYGGQIFILRRSGRALAMLASVNLIFFNVYAYSWALYWILTALIIVLWKGDRDAGQGT